MANKLLSYLFTNPSFTPFVQRSIKRDGLKCLHYQLCNYDAKTTPTFILTDNDDQL